MTLQSLGGHVIIPMPPRSESSAPSYGTITLNAASEKAGFIVQAPVTDDIIKIAFRTGAVTTGETVDVRVETVDATTGDPSGTLWAANTNASQVIADGDDNTWFTVTLTAAASVTKGDMLAIVIAAPGAGVFDIDIATFADDDYMFPYGAVFTTAWSTTTTALGVGGLEYTGGVYHPVMGMWPCSAFNTHTFNNTSTPDVYALKFTNPYKSRATGCWIWADFDGDCVVKLYDSDGVTVLASITLDKDYESETSAGVVLLQFTGTATLEANTTYYLGVEPSTATNLTVYSYDVASAALEDARGLTDWVYATAKDPSGTGSWTETTTRRPFFGLILDQIDLTEGGSVTGIAALTGGGLVR